MTDHIIQSHFMGPASIPLKQANNNAVAGIASTQTAPGKYIPMAMPFKSMTMSQGSGFSQQRHVYNNLPNKPLNKLISAPCTVTSKPLHVSRRMNCSKTPAVVNEMQYAAKKTLLANHSGSDVIARRKSAAIGKSSSMQKHAQNYTQLSFSGANQNTVNSALSRIRGAGCVAPPKKGAIRNPYKGGGCCGI